MDMSDEVFNSQQNADNKKISKNEWREFIDIFKNGQKVSLRNVVKRSNSMEDGDQNENMLHFKKNQPAHELLAEFSQEPALHDFLEFLCGSGSFNLTQIKPELWAANKDLLI